MFFKQLGHAGAIEVLGVEVEAGVRHGARESQKWGPSSCKQAADRHIKIRRVEAARVKWRRLNESRLMR